MGVRLHNKGRIPDPIHLHHRNASSSIGGGSGEVNGTAFRDSDSSGTQNNGETGMPQGILISLYDSTGTIVAQTTTDGNGAYSFTNLPDGNYFSNIGFNDPAIPDGQILGTGSTVPVVISSGNTVTADFGFYTVAVPYIIVKLYVDSNESGTYNSNEDLVSLPTTIQLFDSSNTVVQTQTTDLNGTAVFQIGASGNYKVKNLDDNTQSNSTYQLLGPSEEQVSIALGATEEVYFPYSEIAGMETQTISGKLCVGDVVIPPEIFPALFPTQYQDIDLPNNSGFIGEGTSTDVWTTEDGVRIIPNGQDLPNNPSDWEFEYSLNGVVKTTVPRPRFFDLFTDVVEDIRSSENGSDAPGFSTFSGNQLLETRIKHIPSGAVFYRGQWVDWDVAALGFSALQYNHPNNLDAFPENTYNPTGLPIPTSSEIAFQPLYPSSYVPLDNYTLDCPPLSGVTVDILAELDGSIVDTVVTDANGNYTSGPLPVGVAYEVQVATADTDLAGFDLNTSNNKPVTLPSEPVTQVNFGFYPSIIDLAGSNSDTVLTLNWTDNGAESWNMYYRVQGTTDYTVINGIADPSQVLDSLDPINEFYEIYVTSVSSTGETVASNLLVLFNKSRPSVPLNPSAVMNPDNSITVSWDQETTANADTYRVGYENPNSAGYLLNDPPVSAFTDDIIGAPEGTYDLVVIGTNDQGNSVLAIISDFVVAYAQNVVININVKA